MAAFTLADLKVITDACVGGDSGLGPETVDNIGQYLPATRLPAETRPGAQT